MKILSASDIINIWECGQDQNLLETAATILSAGFPELTRDQLASLSIGERDRYLLELREKNFGKTLKCFSECPNCKKNLEFKLFTSDLRSSQVTTSNGKEDSWELVEENLKLKFRLPNSFDITEVEKSEAKGRKNLILKRCILEATENGNIYELENISDDTLNKLEECIADLDQQAEIIIDLKCSECGFIHKMLFDITSFFWREITIQAQLLLREVHILAYVYGWHEEDILSMSSLRRKYYLNMVT